MERKIKSFWKYVTKSGQEECWIWKGTGAIKWHGNFQYNYVKPSGPPIGRAHRFSFILHNGVIPIGRFVCHKCDVPRCVNPSHLFVGTQLDNIKDMDKKKRRVILNGENHGCHKLTEVDVLEIRSRIKNGEHYSCVAIDKGIAPVTAHAIFSRRLWKHLP